MKIYFSILFFLFDVLWYSFNRLLYFLKKNIFNDFFSSIEIFSSEIWSIYHSLFENFLLSFFFGGSELSLGSGFDFFAAFLLVLLFFQSFFVGFLLDFFLYLKKDSKISQRRSDK